MRFLLISLIFTGLSLSTIKANKILEEDKLAMQEEIFLSKLLREMNITETKNSPTESLNNLRTFLQMFSIIPYICTREQSSLVVDLRPHRSQILGGSSLLLWFPASWLTPSSHFKRRKKMLEKSSNLVGELGWLGVNVTKLARRNLRKGRTHLEIVNLSQKYYIQTAFLEISKENTEKENVGRKKRSQDGTCSLHQISVNLTHIGWDFVISPSILEFRYCSGVCSLTDIPARMFIKQHGQIRYKLERGGTYSLPPACCSPSHYEAVTMVYLDGHDQNGRPIIRRGEFQDSLATSCGCG